MTLSPFRRLFGAPQTSPLESYKKNAAGKEQEERARMGGLIKEQYGQARNILGASRDVGRQRLEEELARRTAIAGGPSGAREKIRQKALTELERGFGQEEAGLKSQEAAALQQSEQDITGRAFGREQLGMQESQFARTLDFQNKEFQENLKTNFVNAAIALKDAGLTTAGSWTSLLADKYGFLQAFSPSIAPNVRTPFGGNKVNAQFV